MSFGGNGILGLSPAAGSTITVDYISTKGATANTATGFTATDTVQFLELHELLLLQQQPLRLQVVKKKLLNQSEQMHHSNMLHKIEW